MQKGRVILATATTGDGEPLTLTLEHGAHVVRVRGETLMSSRLHGSEDEMAELALPQRRTRACGHILVGGLGMGFTLRAVLDRIGAQSRVTVVELFPEVVQWNRGPLAAHANHPLEDPRVRVQIGDLRDFVAACEHQFDAILLDVDNGPEAFTVRANGHLYEPQGVRRLHRALRAQGVLMVWSAFRSRVFERRLAHAGFAAHSVTVRARRNVRKGARHTLFVATKPG